MYRVNFHSSITSARQTDRAQMVQQANCAFLSASTFIPMFSTLRRSFQLSKSVPHSPPSRASGSQCSTQVSSRMKLNNLGSSDILVSEICLGTNTWGVQNSERDAFDQMDYAIHERGINFLDTAEMYPVPNWAPGQVPGDTERYIGNYLSQNPGLRENIVIASKVLGYVHNSKTVAQRFPDRKYEDGKYPDARHDAKSIREACEASLKRLQTDYIDLYQLHWPDRYVPLFGDETYRQDMVREAVSFEDILMGLKPLLDEGKIRAYGLSNETTYGVCQFIQAADKIGMARPITIQNSFCLLDRRFESELAEACSPLNYNLGLLPWSILGGGMLTGKYLNKLDDEGNVIDESIRSARHVAYKGFQERFSGKPAMAATAEYKKVAEKAGISLATLAQAFCKTRHFVPSSIIGATTMQQLKENIDAFEVKLSEEVLGEIDRVHFSNKNVISRY